MTAINCLAHPTLLWVDKIDAYDLEERVSTYHSRGQSRAPERVERGMRMYVQMHNLHQSHSRLSHRAINASLIKRLLLAAVR